MNRFITVLLLLAWAGLGIAAPITYTSTTFTADALAIAGANSDSDSRASPPQALPIIAAAGAKSDNDQNTADAGSAADEGGFLAFLDLTSVTEAVSGAASAEFVGDFVATGRKLVISLLLDVTPDVGINATLASVATLQVVSNGETVLSESFGPEAGSFTRSLMLPVGALASIDLLLSATGEASDGSGFLTSTLSFQVTEAPEAPTLALMLGGLALLTVSRRKALI